LSGAGTVDGKRLVVHHLLVEARAPCLSSRSGLGHYHTYSLRLAGSGRLRNVLETGDQVQSRCRLEKGIWHGIGLRVCQKIE
jgi:hypothetical protein